MLVKTHDHVLAANDHRHAARTRDSDHFIQSVAVFADIKLNVLDSLSRKELLRLATVVSSREAVNLELLHSRLLLGFMLLVCLPAFGVRFHVNFITSPATRHGSACVKSDAKSVSQRTLFEASGRLLKITESSDFVVRQAGQVQYWWDCGRQWP